MSGGWAVARGEWAGPACGVEAKALPSEVGNDRMGAVQSPLATRHAPLPIAGYASLWGVADLNRDVVARGAFSASLARGGAVKMLHGHGGRDPVGLWDTLEEDERGLFVRGRILDWTPESRLAQALARTGAVNGLSIGFRAVRARREGVLRVLVEVELWEVSLVTFPMLPGARFGVESVERGQGIGGAARRAV